MKQLKVTLEAFRRNLKFHFLSELEAYMTVGTKSGASAIKIYLVSTSLSLNYDVIYAFVLQLQLQLQLKKPFVERKLDVCV